MIVDSNSAEITLSAKFTPVLYVFFMDDSGRVFTTKEGVSGQVISLAGVNLPMSGAFGIIGWSKAPGASAPEFVGSITLAGSDIWLYPVIRQGSRITYEAMGGTYTMPMLFAHDQLTVAPTPPVRTGHTFLGWYTDDEELFPFGSPLSGDITLYAHWQPAEVRYTILYWLEKPLPGDPGASLDRYSFYASDATKTAFAGTPVSALVTPTALPAIPYSMFAGFYTDNTEGTVDGNGTTVIHIYYKRMVYTLTFAPGNNASMAFKSSPGAVYTNANPYRIAVKYQQDISQIWPGPNAVEFTSNAAFLYWKSTASAREYPYPCLTLTEDLIPSGGTDTFTAGMCVPFFSDLRCEASSLAIRSSVTTLKESPASGTSDMPDISTGTEGPADATFSPCSVIITRTLPTAVPAMIVSPIFSVPFWTRTVISGPRPLSSLASMTVPLASRHGFARNSEISAVRMIISSRWSMPSPVLAEMGQTIVSPPHSSGTRLYSVSCCIILSGFAPGTSILFIATIIGMDATLAWFIDSTVWGMMPSSAAMVRIAISVTLAPRARIAVNASCPGVSRKVMGLWLMKV